MIQVSRDNFHILPSPSTCVSMKSNQHRKNRTANPAPLSTIVYQLLSRIPAGRVSTYGDVAAAAGNARASRAIGRILNKNPNPIVIPCHRVVMSNGKLGGYAFGSARKKALLEKEGLQIASSFVQNFHRVRFNNFSS